MIAQYRDEMTAQPKAELITRPEPIIEHPVRREPGLRDDSDRAPIVAQTGPYKESAVNLRPAELVRQLGKLRSARSTGIGFLPKCQAHIQMLEQRIQALDQAHSDTRAELLICRQLLWIHVKQLQLEYLSELRAFQFHRPHIIAETKEVNRRFERLYEAAKQSAKDLRRNQRSLIIRYHAEIEELSNKARLHYLDLIMHYHTHIKQVAESIRRECLDLITQSTENHRLDLHDLDIGLCELTQRLCELVEKEIATVQEERVRKEKLYAAPLAKKRDRDHQRRAPQRHADRNAWWARIERRIESTDQLEFRRFVDLSGELDDFAVEYKVWYYEYILTLPGHYINKRLPDSVKELLSRIETTVLKLIEGFLFLMSDAHFTRSYRRARLIWSVEPGPFRYRAKEFPLTQNLDALCLSAIVLKIQTASFSRVRSIRDGVISKVQAPELSDRLTQLASLITFTSRNIRTIAVELYFGILSDESSQATKLRRAQAAALKPFWESLNVMATVSDKLIEVIRAWERTATIERLESFLEEWNYRKRLILDALDLFSVANWTSNKHRLSTRTIFQRRPSQPEPPLSPVIFTVPPRYPRGPSWNYNDYRGPNGEMIAICHSRDSTNLESVLTEVKHNGVIAVDVRGVTRTDRFLGRLPSLLGHEASVVTLSTESHIVVCHFIQMGNGFRISSSLKFLLENPRIIKVGMNIEDIKTRFERYLGIHMTGTCDVASLNAAFEVVSSAASQYPQSRSLPTIVKRNFDLVLPATPSSGDFWICNLSLNSLRCKKPPTTVNM
jgi:hypothetical protein